MNAFILAAGLGKRLLPLTKEKPKALVSFNGIPMLEGVIRRLADAGINRVMVNVHHYADQVISFLETLEMEGLDILISDERDRLMETGGALLKARDFLTGESSFIVHNVDVVTNLDINRLITAHRENGALVTMAVKERPTSRSLLFDDSGMLCGWQHNQTGELKEVRTPQGGLHALGNSCIQVINREFLDQFTSSSPMSLTQMYLDLAAGHSIRAHLHNEDYWYDLGRYTHFLEAEKEFTDLNHHRK